MYERFNQPEITHKVLEVLGNNFSYEEIIQIGRRLKDGFTINVEDNMYGRLRLQPHTAAEHLINCVRKNKTVDKLVQFLIDLDCCSLDGRTINIAGLEDILVILRREGVRYDYKTRKFYEINECESLPEWEKCLKEDKEYEFCFVSVDTVKSSKLSKVEDKKSLEHTYLRLFDLIKTIACRFNGSVWSWQGDGGLVVFYGQRFIRNSICFGFELLGLLPTFNINESGLSKQVHLRIGIDKGMAPYREDKGSIVSSSINTAAHLEKYFTADNTISITERVYSSLQPRQKMFFKNTGEMEGQAIYRYSPSCFYGTGPYDTNNKENGNNKNSGRKKKGLFLKGRK
ncbi:MAG: hypothetical protein ACOC7U_02720 [Spirochaetota bacterium]